MTKAISQLPAAVAVAGTDEVELNQAGASRKATLDQVGAGLGVGPHTHLLADITDAGDLAGQDTATLAQITDAGALAALDAVTLALVTDAGALAALNVVDSAQIQNDAVETAKIAAAAVTAAKLANTTVVAGQYTLATITVDAQGRITAAANGNAAGFDDVAEPNDHDVTPYAVGATGANKRIRFTATKQATHVALFAQANLVADEFGALKKDEADDAVVWMLEADDTLGSEVTFKVGTVTFPTGTQLRLVGTVVWIYEGGGVVSLDGDVQVRGALLPYEEAELGLAIAAGTLTVDLEIGNTFYSTIDGDFTLAPSNLPAAGRAQGWTLRFEIDGTGAHAVTWPASSWLWPDGEAPTFPQAANAIAVLNVQTIRGVHHASLVTFAAAP